MIPNLTIAVPKDVKEFEEFLRFSVDYSAPLAIRYPRSGKKLLGEHSAVILGKWETLVRGDGKYAVIACGERMLDLAMSAAEKLGKSGVKISVINARFVKPLDEDLLNSLSEKHIITLEDNMLLGGFGALIDVYFSESEKTIKNFAYTDKFISQGSVSELMDELEVNSEALVDYVIKNENR